MKKILPVCEKPSVKTCIHYAYPCAIIENPLLSRIITEFSQKDGWNESFENVYKVVDINNIDFYVDDSSANKFSYYMWRECKEKERIDILIDQFKEINLYRYVDVLVFYGDEENELLVEDKQCSIRWNQYGLFTGKDMHCLDTKKYKYIRTNIFGNYVEFLTSSNGKKWEVIKIISIEKRNNEKLKVLIQLYWGEDTYKAWKCMNFIQLLYNKDDPNRGITLDYYFSPRKNYDNGYGYYSNFLDTYYDYAYDFVDCFDTFKDFVIWGISHGFYISVCLDEYLLQGRRCYNSFHYNHYNMIYGYDTDKEIYYVMGFEDDVVVSDVPFEIIQFDTLMSEKIIRYRYKLCDTMNYSFSKEGLIRQLKEFVMSITSSQNTDNILTPEPLEYGIDILDKVLTNKEELEKLFRDKRIAFLIMEHSEKMKERIDYVFSLGIITRNEYDELRNDAETVVKFAKSLLVDILKCIVMKKQSCKAVVCLKNIYNTQKNLCLKLIKYLSSMN